MLRAAAGAARRRRAQPPALWRPLEAGGGAPAAEAAAEAAAACSTSGRGDGDGGGDGDAHRRRSPPPGLPPAALRAAVAAAADAAVQRPRQGGHARHRWGDDSRRWRAARIAAALDGGGVPFGVRAQHSGAAAAGGAPQAGAGPPPPGGGADGGGGGQPGAAAGGRVPPAPAEGWLRSLPAGAVPYAQLMRLDKPIGVWLLAWPCFWSIALAAPAGGPPDVALLALFGAGAVLLRGAGCTVNDLWDRRLDAQVARTAGRPLASGALTPAAAVGALAAQLAAGLAILLQLNAYSVALGAASLPLVAAYPGMKRITYWPQAFLGLTMNWGALLGWAAARGACDWAVVGPLYAAGAAWTMVYDTIYAHQDARDDAVVGIMSTALLFGGATKPALAAFAAANLGLLAAAGAAAGAGAPFYAGVAAAGGHLAWQLASVRLADPADCGAKFRSNVWYGAAVFTGIVADRALAGGDGGVALAAAASLL